MPVTLERLAEYLRDGELIDMRVLHEDEIVTLERVCIHEINIRKYDEGLLVTQEFVDGETKLSHDIVVECDNVLKAWPTGLELATVNPVRTLEPEPDTLEDTDGIMERAWTAVADEHDIVLDVPRWRGMVMDNTWMSAGRNIDVRHLVILVAWHTSEMQPERICKLVGYRSQQPFLTAAWKCHLSVFEEKLARTGPKNDRYRGRAIQVKNWCAAVERCVKIVLASGGRLRTEERRTSSWVLKP